MYSHVKATNSAYSVHLTHFRDDGILWLIAAGLAGTAQSSVASSTDVVVSVHLLFQCSEACYYDERCVSFEWDPASGDCKPLNLLPGAYRQPLSSVLR